MIDWRDSRHWNTWITIFSEFVTYYDANDAGEDGKTRQKLAQWLGLAKSGGQGLLLLCPEVK